MNMIRVNEQLVEIVHLASAAILCDDENVVRQAIADIEEALGEIKRSADFNITYRYHARPSFPLPTIPSGADGTEPAEPTAEELENA